MHSVLRIPEIQLLILEFLVQGQKDRLLSIQRKYLTSLALSCKTFYWAIIPILWKSVPSLTALIFLFPLDLWEFTSVPIPSLPRELQSLSFIQRDDEDHSSSDSSY